MAAMAREHERSKGGTRQEAPVHPGVREWARRNGGRSLAEIADEQYRREAPILEAQARVQKLVALAERDASRRGDLFGAIRETVAMLPSFSRRDAALVARLATVLLDAGRPIHESEARRRIGKRWGEHLGESAMHAARSSGAVRADMYGMLYLERPVGEDRGEGEDWMYRDLERAVVLGAARYTDSGIEMTGRPCAGLSARELAGAEAVAAGVTEYGEPPGLAAWLDGKDCPERVTWAEATVDARAARAEVGAAWARISRGRAGAAAPEGEGLREEPLYGSVREWARRNEGRSFAEIADEQYRREAPIREAQGRVKKLVALAERDASRRGELFGAIREALATLPSFSRRDAALVARLAAVLLDAGRPLHVAEASRRIEERWGEHFGESAMYAARSSGAVRADTCGVLYLQRPVGDGRGEGEDWMYEALERAVELGAARYTNSGIEMTGRACAGLSARELAGAEAVATGVTEYGEPPGLDAWLDRCHRRRGGGRRTTWAEATVVVRAARAEVGAAWARISKRCAMAAAAPRLKD